MDSFCGARKQTEFIAYQERLQTNHFYSKIKIRACRISPSPNARVETDTLIKPSLHVNSSGNFKQGDNVYRIKGTAHSIKQNG